MANGEVEGVVLFFNHKTTAKKYGMALLPSGEKAFLPAATFGNGLNGSRPFPSKGDIVLVRAIPMQGGKYATSWRLKPKENEAE
jgi:hypothetical protein